MSRRFYPNLVVSLALIGATACGDNIQPVSPQADASPQPDAEVPDAAPPDAMWPPDGIQDALDTPVGPAAVDIARVWVTYVKPLVGNDPAGFFVQRSATGPALFVAVDPATLTPAPAVGDLVSFTVDNMNSAGDLAQADAISGFAVESSGADVSWLVQDVTNAADLTSAVGDYAAELVTINATFTSGFGFAGTGHSKADIDSGALTGDPDLALRMPEAMATDLTTTYTTVAGCSASTTATPLWHFFAEVQVHVWDPEEISVTCVPKVQSALALSATTVRLSFNRPIDPASITDASAQFTVDNGLSVTAAVVSGSLVTLTTSQQDPAINYTVTVASSVTDVSGPGVDPAANSAAFMGYVVVPPPEIVINEVDYDQAGSDVAEFIELYNYGATPVDLADLSVVLVNGNNSAEYNRIDLASVGTLPAGGYLLIANAGVTAPVGVPVITIADSNVQNGAPDAVALVNVSRLELIDALSYEGAINAAAINGFPGAVDLVQGNPTAAVDPGDGSLARTPNGADTGDDGVDWVLAAVPTPGASN